MASLRHLVLLLTACSVDVEGEVACTNACDDEKVVCYEGCDTTCDDDACVSTCESGCETTHGECTVTCTGGGEGRPSE